MPSPRVAALAVDLMARTITPDQIPVYDRALVQEELLRLWLVKRLAVRSE